MQYSKAGLFAILLGTAFQVYSLVAQFGFGQRDFNKFLDIEIAGLVLILFGLMIIVFEYYGYQPDGRSARSKYYNETV